MDELGAMVGGEKPSEVAGGAAGAGAAGGAFLGHMFRFDATTKGDLANILQYSALGAVPVILMLKIVKNYFPDVVATKSTAELTFECVAELAFILLSVYFIDRFASYFPPYSGQRYERLDLTQTILVFMVVLFTIQTKLGTKMNIVLDRITNNLEGYSNKAKAGEGGHMGNVSIMRALSDDSQPAPHASVPMIPSAGLGAAPGGGLSIVPSGSPGPGGASGMFQGGDSLADGPASMNFASELSGSIY